MSSDIINDFNVGAWAVVLFMHNISGMEFAALVFGDMEPSYQRQVAERWVESKTRAIGQLDHKRRAKFLELVKNFEEASARKQMEADARFR